MATLLLLVNPPFKKVYLDKSHYQSVAEQRDATTNSSTVYVGNLSFFTTEEQIYELFTKVGLVDRIVMGLHRVEKTPCGFCFVVFHERLAAVDAEQYFNGAVLDGRVIKVEKDPGFKEGRQYGRARSGGQVRDEVRVSFDADRGGYGALVGAGVEPANSLAAQITNQPPPSAPLASPDPSMPPLLQPTQPPPFGSPMSFPQRGGYQRRRGGYGGGYGGGYRDHGSFRQDRDFGGNNHNARERPYHNKHYNRNNSGNPPSNFGGDDRKYHPEESRGGGEGGDYGGRSRAGNKRRFDYDDARDSTVDEFGRDTSRRQKNPRFRDNDSDDE